MLTREFLARMEPIDVRVRLGDVTVVDEIERPLEVIVDSAAVPVVLDFRGFFSDHHGRIASALAMTLRDDDLGSEAAAEAMARAYQNWDEVGAYGNPQGWVYRVGLNWARSRRRKLMREVFRSDSADHPARPGPEIEPELDAALASLSVDQRSVVVLRYLLDWSESQTAEALDIAPGTVKSRLSRALDRLAVVLEDSDES
jgi:RNA polymerase sigma-70 factor, ECF subfamily